MHILLRAFVNSKEVGGKPVFILIIGAVACGRMDKKRKTGQVWVGLAQKGSLPLSIKNS